MKIRAQFTHDKINHTQDTDLHMVVSLEAPAIEWAETRPSVCIIPVVDLSGSMGGQKLDGAKASLRTLVEHLGPNDVCGLIGFESQVRDLVEPRPVTGEHKALLLNTIEKLEAQGGTDFAGGMLRALNTAKNLDLPPKFMHRVILFTDGEPTVGVTDKGQIVRMLKENMGHISVSAFGYGAVQGANGMANIAAMFGTCDQAFLLDFSKEGKGNYAYVQEPDAALAAFGKELGGLLSTYANDIRISIEPQNGHRVTEVISDVEHEKDVTGQLDVSVSDILAEETRNLVFAIKLDKQKTAHPRPTTVFDLKVDYSVIDEKGARLVQSTSTKAKVRFVKDGQEQKKPNKAVDEIVALAQVASNQRKAQEKADVGDFVGAVAVMQNVSQEVSSRGYVALSHTAEGISQRLGDAGVYAESSGYLQSFNAGAERGTSVMSYDADARRDLVTSNCVLSNSVQERVMTSFTTSGQTPESPQISLEDAVLATPDLTVTPQK